MADKITFTTPKGIAVYPRLKSPDTKYDDNGVYKADLKMPLETAKPLIDKLTKMFKDHTGRSHPKNPERDNRKAFYYMELDDNDDETGNVVFKLRVKNKITKKGDLWDRRPAQFDARGKAIVNPLNVGGGTEMRVSFEVYLWSNPDGKGMSLQPEAVQIIELVEFTGNNKSADNYGFGEEDGFSADDDDHGFSDETDDSGDDYVSADEDDDDY